MRIEELSVRTLKEDNALKIQDEENLLVRGGFVRKIGGKLYHTELGMMVLRNIRSKVEGILEKKGFSRLGIEGSMDLREVRDRLHDYMKSETTSYRDLPMGLAYMGQVRYNRQGKDSLWLRNHEETVVFSYLHEGDHDGLRDSIEGILEAFGLSGTLHGDEIFFAMEGKGSYPDHLYLKEREKRMIPDSREAVGSVREVLTKDVRTITELREFFSCNAQDILKTILFTYGGEHYGVILEGNHNVDVEKVKAFLDITDDDFKAMDEATIRHITGAEPGFSGPAGLKGVRILVDVSVEKGKLYYAGANRTDHHVAGVIYGRDFTGEQGDFAKEKDGRQGYRLGRMKTMKEAIRFRKVDDSLAAAKADWGYLNLSRLMLALCRANLDDIGIDLPKEIAPFEVAVLPLDTRDKDLVAQAETLHDDLISMGFRTLLDTRKARFGVKLKDCDLLCVKKRVLVGRRKDEGTYELKDRSGEITIVNLEELVEMLRT